MKLRVVVGVTGTSGSIYGCRRLEKLCERAGWESHPILSRPDKKSASLTLGKLGTTWKPLAHCHYPIADIVNRRLTSGSFQTSAMVVTANSTINATLGGPTISLAPVKSHKR